MPAVTTTPDRHARRRETTRTKLVDAAKALFARQGVDNTRIQEITEEADVGFGSFYNHFQSKEALIEVVLADTIAAQGAEIAAPVTIPTGAGCSCGSMFLTTSCSPPSARTPVATSVPVSGLAASACRTKGSLYTPPAVHSCP
jgi:AcrR family transcriptional regulator